MKKNLIGLSFDELNAELVSIGEKPFRTKEIIDQQSGEKEKDRDQRTRAFKGDHRVRNIRKQPCNCKYKITYWS